MFLRDVNRTEDVDRTQYKEVPLDFYSGYIITQDAEMQNRWKIFTLSGIIIWLFFIVVQLVKGGIEGTYQPLAILSFDPRQIPLIVTMASGMILVLLGNHYQNKGWHQFRQKEAT